MIYRDALHRIIRLLQERNHNSYFPKNAHGDQSGGCSACKAVKLAEDTLKETDNG